MAPVETVLFDVDDTLCAYHRSTAEVLDVAFERADVAPFFGVEEYLGRYAEFVPSTDTVEELRAECFAAIAEERGRDPSVGRRVAAERDHGNVRPLPGLREALDALADRRLAVVTNGAPGMQAEKLDALGLTGAFEAVVHAGYDAPAKPDPEPFHRALDHVGGRPERAVHVGDSLDADVAGARAAGLRTAWLRRDGESPGPERAPDYALESLHDLVEPPWA